MQYCESFHSNPPNSCCDISVWNKVVQLLSIRVRQTDMPCRAMPLVWLNNYINNIKITALKKKLRLISWTAEWHSVNLFSLLSVAAAGSPLKNNVFRPKSCDKSARWEPVMCDGDREQGDRRSAEPKSSILLRLKQQPFPRSYRTMTHGLIQESRIYFGMGYISFL